VAREELPHSIMVTAEPFDEDEVEADPARDEILRFRVTIRVERDSQKGIVIGRGGQVLRDAGTAARLEAEQLLGARVHLETRVRVDRDWQRRAHSLDRLGL
jgi:GTP-binding protein Era